MPASCLLLLELRNARSRNPLTELIIPRIRAVSLPTLRPRKNDKIKSWDWHPGGPAMIARPVTTLRRLNRPVSAFVLLTAMWVISVNFSEAAGNAHGMQPRRPQTKNGRLRKRRLRREDGRQPRKTSGEP